MSEFTFQTLRKHVLNYAERKRLLKPIKEMDFCVKSEFLLLLGVHGIVPKREPISLDAAIAKYRELFLDWHFFEREERSVRNSRIICMGNDDFATRKEDSS